MSLSRFSSWRAGAVLALALSSIAVPASADQISYTSYQVVDDVNVSIVCNSIAGCVNGYYGSGEINFFDGNTRVAQTWCVDVAHDLLGGGTFDVTVAAQQQQNPALSNVMDGAGHYIAWNTLGEIGGLMQYGLQNIDGINDPNHALSSAIQLAIWTLEYGANNISLQSDSASVQSLLNALLTNVQNGAYGYDWNLAWLHHCNQDRCDNQGQLELYDAPEPAGLPVFGAALLAIVGVWLFRRNRKV